MNFNYQKEKKFLQYIKDGYFIFTSDGDVIRVKTNHKYICKDRCGYIVVRIGNDTIKAHRLVWMNYTRELIPKDCVINHKNGIKTDNRIENLEAILQEENVRHAYRTKLAFNEKNKPTANFIKYANQILELRNQKFTRKEIAEKLNINLRVIDRSIRYLKEQHKVFEEVTNRPNSKYIIYSDKILNLHNQGLSNSQISKKLNLSLATINYSIDYLKSQGKL